LGTMPIGFVANHAVGAELALFWPWKLKITLALFLHLLITWAICFA
jgi:hypothetical protein